MQPSSIEHQSAEICAKIIYMYRTLLDQLVCYTVESNTSKHDVIRVVV